MNFAPFRGNLLLFDFYFKNLHQIKALPKWMRNPDSLIEEVESKWQNGKNQSFTLELPKTIAQSYNEKFDKMKAEMRKLHVNESEKLSYKTTLILLFAIRLMCIYTAWQGNVLGTIFLSSLQFLVAPYSLFVSFGLAVALGPPIYFSHYLSFNGIQAMMTLLGTCFVPNSMMPWITWIGSYLEVPINPGFILAFFIYDQGLCFYVHYFTPSKTFTAQETLIHVTWGFLNTKTYTLMLLLHMMNAGVVIPVWIWLIDAGFKITLRISNLISQRWMHWMELFYHQHRMAHLPKVINLRMNY